MEYNTPKQMQDLQKACDHLQQSLELLEKHQQSLIAGCRAGDANQQLIGLLYSQVAPAVLWAELLCSRVDGQVPTIVIESEVAARINYDNHLRINFFDEMHKGNNGTSAGRKINYKTYDWEHAPTP